MLDMAQIEAEALRQLQEEAHLAAVAKAKEHIRAHMGRPWWKRLIPFTIKIEWAGYV